VGRFATAVEKVGKVQCCVQGNYSYCVRKVEGTCFSGENDTTLMTYTEAVTTCESNGYRLCTKEELLTDNALGCCGAGCSMDDALVWTSTFSYTTLKAQNEGLKDQIDNVKAENMRLETQHQDLAGKIDQLQAQVIQAAHIFTTPYNHRAGGGGAH